MHYRSSYIATGSIKLYNYIYWITMGSRKEKYKEKLRQKRRADDLFVMEILERLKTCTRICTGYTSSYFFI